ncbi:MULTISPECIES: fluoride efflux transporter CrcB [Rhodococcus]|uniref:Fluoride-specific ion channel FluC n=2 Tax=Rhodococcus opacus TaxID=37919 RepID=C1BCT3_RHOOB|nr:MULTISPECIES: fluoride efflux transporter CrcB [Rhodococcus]QQZ19176.1 fluoride efflux transporter CrcB [Rhodococcus sp. 21391]UOT07944.1 fluoride efflux transporter CrcB [Rhodococcus opacus]BAH55677.1 CrcB protein homolog [Rhodococcus opacus B4]
MMVWWIACAGSVGAIARFVVDGAIKHRRSVEFPWATAAINVTGSLLLGFVVGLVLFHGVPREVQLIVGVGFCGGYTTFSTASFETVRLIHRGRYAAGVTNAVGTLLVTVAAGAAGLALAGI